MAANRSATISQAPSSALVIRAFRSTPPTTKSVSVRSVFIEIPSKILGSKKTSFNLPKNSQRKLKVEEEKNVEDFPLSLLA